MGEKIKVKDIRQASPGTNCGHYVVTFDMGDGTEHTEVVHVDDPFSLEEETEFVRGWLRHQFKHKANKTKLRGKEIASVEK